MEIAAAHHIPYVATATVAYPQDLIKKVKKAFEKQPSFVHIHCPCPTGWKHAESDTVEIAKLAVETRMWVLYEIEDGKVRLTKRVDKPKPVKEYLDIQGRFNHLQSGEIKTIKSLTDQEYEKVLKWEDCGMRF